MVDARRLTIIATTCLLAACAGTGGPRMGTDHQGKLAPCPASPNCVSSDAGDPGHRIEPLVIRGDPRVAWQALIEYLETNPAFTIVDQRDDYLHAEARTRWLRFVDDVEFQLRPNEGVIAMRSASRLGYSDLGANRRRLEAVRQTLNAG